MKEPVNDLTPTFLTDRILATLRSADSVVNKILQESGNERDSLVLNKHYVITWLLSHHTVVWGDT